MQLSDQIDNLVKLGVAKLSGTTEREFRELGTHLPGDCEGIVVVHPMLLTASKLGAFMSLGGKPGFVVEDMTDLDEFVPRPEITIPASPLYFMHDLQRGDDMQNWSPEEALIEITKRGRTPLTISEGISWLLQMPNQLEPNKCFMCIASRKPKDRSVDSRTPAIWISGGTGRDGKERRGAPKVGWCWANNRHTWLGFATAAGRRGA
jgi:hypothetical protein